MNFSRRTKKTSWTGRRGPCSDTVDRNVIGRTHERKMSREMVEGGRGTKDILSSLSVTAISLECLARRLPRQTVSNGVRRTAWRMIMSGLGTAPWVFAACRLIEVHCYLHTQRRTPGPDQRRSLRRRRRAIPNTHVAVFLLICCWPHTPLSKGEINRIFRRCALLR